MAIVSRSDLDETTRRLILSSGDIVELRIGDAEVDVYANGKKVGDLEFRTWEEPSNNGYQDITVCRLTGAFIEGEGGRYKRQGIGTEAIRYFLEYTGYEFDIPEQDGRTKQDGSHVVQDGAAFMAHIERLCASGKLRNPKN